MKPLFECALCGAQYQPDHVRQWGKHQDSLHLGARPVCTAVVKDHLGSNATCRGDLFAVGATEADAAKIAAPRPIAL